MIQEEKSDPRHHKNTPIQINILNIPAHLHKDLILDNVGNWAARLSVESCSCHYDPHDTRFITFNLINLQYVQEAFQNGLIIMLDWDETHSDHWSPSSARKAKFKWKKNLIKQNKKCNCWDFHFVTHSHAVSTTPCSEKNKKCKRHYCFHKSLALEKTAGLKSIMGNCAWFYCLLP